MNKCIKHLGILIILMAFAATATANGVETSQPGDQTIKVGETATYELTITNRGDTDDSYDITYADIDGAGTGTISLNKATTATLSKDESDVVVLNVTPTSAGTFNVNVTATSNANSTVSVTTDDIKTTSELPSTGYRIWDEGENMPSTYTWTAKSFTGFYYDLDDDKSTETLTITGIDRSLNENAVVYETTAIEIDTTDPSMRTRSCTKLLQ